MRSGLRYREFPPSPALRPWVECIWSLAGTPEVAPSRRHRVLPDGSIDILFGLGDPWTARRRGDRTRLRPTGYVIGTMTEALLVDHGPRPSFVGVRFRPGRGGALLSRGPAQELTDAAVRLEDLWGADARALEEGLWTARDEHARVRLVDEAVARRLAAAELPGPSLLAAVDSLTRLDQPVEALARRLGVSRQKLAREFRRHVGISPRRLGRVMRFRRLLRDLDRGARGWASLAARHGWYDQAHMSGDCRDLAGLPPARLLAERSSR